MTLRGATLGLALTTIGAILWMSFQETPQLPLSTDSPAAATLPGDKKHKSHDHSHKASRGTASSVTSKGHTTSFRFQSQAEKVQQLAENFPGSRTQLLKIAMDSDPFKNKDIGVKPHSLSEVQQNQMGAVKVMALRELMNRQQDLGILYADLTRVINQAQDPTISRIAQAARDSLDQGRSFFEDFLAGIDKLPLTD